MTIECLTSEIKKFTGTVYAHGKWSQRRQDQDLNWFRQEVMQQVLQASLRNKKYEKQIQGLELDYLNSKKSFEEAMREILAVIGLD